VANTPNDSPELKLLTERFKDLLSGEALSEEEKHTLAGEILKIIYSSSEDDA